MRLLALLLLACCAGLAQSTQAAASQIRRHPTDRPGATLASMEQIRIIGTPAPAADRLGITLAGIAQWKPEMIIDAGRVCLLSWMRVMVLPWLDDFPEGGWPPEFRPNYSFNLDGSRGQNSPDLICPVTE